MFQGLEIKFGFGEGGLGRQEGHLRPGQMLPRPLPFRHARGGADIGQRGHGITMGKTHFPHPAQAPDPQLQHLRQGIHHRNAHAVQAAGDLVAVLVELTAGMQLGHDDLGRRHALFLVDIHGDAATIVAHGHRPIGIKAHIHPVGMAGQRLVNGVVHHLIHHVVQAGPVIGVADIHAGAFADSVQPLQHLDGTGAIFLCGCGNGRGGGGGVIGVRHGNECSRKWRKTGVKACCGA